MSLYLVLRTLHLICMATWFGVVLLVPGNLRRALEASPQHLPLVLDQAVRAGRVATIAGWATVLTGFVLIFERGGFGEVPVPIHIGITTTLAMLAVGALGVGATLRKMQERSGQPDGPASGELEALRGRLSMFSGIFQGLWLLTLLLMVFRYQLM